MTGLRQLSARACPASGGTVPVLDGAIGISVRVVELSIHNRVGICNSYNPVRRSKGSLTCQSEIHSSSSQRVPVSRPAETLSASKRLVAVRSVQALQPSQAVALYKVRPSVQAPTYWHASQAQCAVTNPRHAAALGCGTDVLEYPAGPAARAGFFRSLKTQKDSPCSTRS